MYHLVSQKIITSVEFWSKPNCRENYFIGLLTFDSNLFDKKYPNHEIAGGWGGRDLLDLS